jgi:hypothetical protein
MGSIPRDRLCKGNAEGIQMKKTTRLPPFVPLLREMLASPAWRAMSPYARCLYMALKAQHTAKNNNGHIFLGQRGASEETGISRPKIAQCFRELMHYGFIVMTTPGCLGSDGNGKAPHWRLTELETSQGPATSDFKHWTGNRFRKNKSPADILATPGQ